MKKIVLFTLLVLNAFNINAQEKWLWQEEVVFKDSHDPLIIELVGKKDMEYQNSDSHEIVSLWKKGKKLLLVYNTEKGINLLDKKTNTLISIATMYGKHPIDALLEYNLSLDKNRYTMGITSCYDEASGYWDLYLNKTYKEFMKILPETEREDLRYLQRKWIIFRDAQSKILYKSYWGENSGTISNIEVASSKKDVVRNQALALNRYYRAYIGTH